MPPLTVEAMRRLCQEMMKQGYGDYVFKLGEWTAGGDTVTNATRNDSEKTVELS